MAAPWSASHKTVGVKTSVIGTGAVTAFVPPAIASSQGFSPIPFFAAIARMQALRGAPASITAALERAATALTEAIVDDAGTDFDLLPEAEQIELTPRRALSRPASAPASATWS